MTSPNRMNNLEVKNILKDCAIELQQIKKIISTNTSIKFNKITKYLIDYSIIKACSTIERSYKKIIADFFEYEQSLYVKNFISKKVRHDSSNPNLNMINLSLKSFDDKYNNEFNNIIKKNRKKYEHSLENLSDARNNVAHGWAVTVDLNFIITNFEISEEMIANLDEVLKTQSNNPQPH